MRPKAEGRAAKVVLACIGVVLLGAVGTVSAVAAKYDAKVAPKVVVGPVPVGGLSREEAERKLSEWWAGASQKEVSFSAPELVRAPEGLTLDGLGVRLDLEKTLAQAPREDFWAYSARTITGQVPPPRDLKPVFAVDAKAETLLAAFVKDNLRPHRPARADLVNGQIVRDPEQTTVELERDAVPAVLEQAALTGGEVRLPLKKAAVAVSDEDLAKITDVVSSFTSSYNEGNENRASNIRNAARRLSGTVLLPGQTFSFNGVLGQRTAKNGFKLAGVYNNGKHDFDIGGGICQVSGTLYNSVLLADLKIVQRSNHTFPVPYLPVGRDATVSFPAPDFAFMNDRDTPIAVSAQAGGGKITFRILGVKDPSVKVVISTAGHSSWGNAVKTVPDASLAPGRRVVEEPGGSGHRIMTFRTVFRDGVEVKKENLGTSYYPGGTRVVRVGPAKGKPAAAPAPATAPPATMPETVPPIADGGH